MGPRRAEIEMGRALIRAPILHAPQQQQTQFCPLGWHQLRLLITRSERSQYLAVALGTVAQSASRQATGR
jgi:hypothetical protein